MRRNSLRAAEARRLAADGMRQCEIARKLNISNSAVHYALKREPRGESKMQIAARMLRDGAHNDAAIHSSGLSPASVRVLRSLIKHGKWKFAS